MHGGEVNKYAALLHHFFQMPKAQGVSCVPTGAYQHHFQWTVQFLEYIAQLGDDRGLDHVLPTAIVMLGHPIATEPW